MKPHHRLPRAPGFSSSALPTAAPSPVATSIPPCSIAMGTAAGGISHPEHLPPQGRGFFFPPGFGGTSLRADPCPPAAGLGDVSLQLSPGWGAPQSQLWVCCPAAIPANSPSIHKMQLGLVACASPTGDGPFLSSAHLGVEMQCPSLLVGGN